MISNMGAVHYKVLYLGLLIRFALGLHYDHEYVCKEGYCTKKLTVNKKAALSLGECQLVCNEWASLWPKPTGRFSKGSTVKGINPSKIFFNYQKRTPVEKSIRTAKKNFINDVGYIIGSNPRPRTGTNLVININIQNPDITDITLDTNESYYLQINKSISEVVQVFVDAPNYFGARHGLQTLAQLIVYDNLRNELKILDKVLITDGPAYPYRGLLLDTSRNFITIDSIKRTLRGMAASKLNRFHWHLTDTQSFPYVSRSHPELAKYGAYTPKKVYRSRDIREIWEYARVRGIRIVPELDTPSHVGAGWEKTGFVTCFNWQPWQKYCVEPPCGQLNPTVDGLYDLIEDLFGDMIADFQPDIVHFGGDEVSFSCWNATESIVDWMRNRSLETTEANFVKVVQYYQQKALERLYRKTGSKLPIIVWQSQLTRPQYINSSYSPENVIVQIWANAAYPQNQLILESNFKVILSNYDALYLDCGLGSWNTDGMVNWCSPHKSWQMIYNNTPAVVAGNRKNQVLGQEAAMWTEQQDSTTMDIRIWPRAAAMAEVVWSEPTTDWKAAEVRYLVHRERLVQLGINAQSEVPEWCLNNQEFCRTDSYFNLRAQTSTNN